MKMKNVEKKSYEDKLKQSLDVQKLQHERDTTQLQAQVEVHKNEVENLKMTLNRYAEELSSQKELTSSVVSGIRTRDNNSVVNKSV